MLQSSGMYLGVFRHIHGKSMYLYKSKRTINMLAYDKWPRKLINDTQMIRYSEYRSDHGEYKAIVMEIKYSFGCGWRGT